MIVTNSKLKSYLACQRSYWYKYDRLLVPKLTAQPFKRGTWLHELLESHYNGYGWKKRHAELTEEFNRLFDEEKEYYGDLPDFCNRVMASYVFHWKKEDATLKYIAAEDECEVPLPGPGNHTFRLKFDMIVEDEYGRWLFENKSHNTIPGADYRFLDTQSNLYVWALNELGTYGEIVGICWNYLRAKAPTIPKLLKSGTALSKAKIDTDALTMVRAIKEYGLDLDDYRDVISRLQHGTSTYFRRERVPAAPKVVETLVAEAAYTAGQMERGYEPVRTISRSCEYCSYKDLCVVDLYGGNSKQMIKLKYKPADKKEYYGFDTITP